jgi:hypothetical protein
LEPALENKRSLSARAVSLWGVDMLGMAVSSANSTAGRLAVLVELVYASLVFREIDLDGSRPEFLEVVVEDVCRNSDWVKMSKFE